MTKTPTITSHAAHSTVHTRLLLATGVCGGASGNLWVSAHNYNFPPQSYPVRDGVFKALIHLSPGHNDIRLDFNEATPAAAGGYTTYTGAFALNYLPLLQNPPLHLAIVLGSDSAGTFDDAPGCAHPPSLDTAVRRLRMAGYLWAAYTGAQMHAHNLGHRSFRLDEAWLPDSLTAKDAKKRTTAKVTVLRSKYSTKHIRDPARAQQNKKATCANGAGSLFDIAMDAVNAHAEFRSPGGEKVYVAALFLDAHYDGGLIRGHAALGGGTDKVGLAIFGSHMLFSWPGALEEVVPAFTDTRRVDTAHCGVDAEGSSYYMAANIGLGAFLHEVGHAFGCPHQPSGIMLRDYPRLNHCFCAASPAGAPAGRPCDWHRLDALRFRCHPAFALSTDPTVPGAMSIAGVDDGLRISAPAGLLLLEFRTPASEFPKAWLEFADAPPVSFTLSRRYLADNVSTRLESISLSAFALNNSQLSTPDLAPLLAASAAGVHRSMKHGLTRGAPQHTPIPPALRHIRVFSGAALDGLEFFPADGGASVLFGRRGGSAKEFPMHPGETLLGFGVRAGGWVDALQVVTERRRGEWWGGSGGGVAECVVPEGYRVTAVWGEVERWVVGIGIEYARV
ncbi:putative peptidase family-domain-containing protein [Geopyxis carbonaria]|nr:putative peptidase family-domain-containing protein [Geopyxis carbonaria]